MEKLYKHPKRQKWGAVCGADLHGAREDFATRHLSPTLQGLERGSDLVTPPPLISALEIWSLSPLHGLGQCVTIDVEHPGHPSCIDSRKLLRHHERL